MPWFDPPLRAPGMETLADGEHEGVRWWLQRLDGFPQLQLTVSGVVGEHAVIAFAEFATADPAAVEGYLTALLAKKREGWERKAEMAAGRPAVASSAPMPKPAPKGPVPAHAATWSTPAGRHPGRHGCCDSGMGRLL